MHINSVHFFGGYTYTILYYNMKQVVLELKIKASKSKFNREFMSFSEYYGTIVRL
ncbi:MAG: hypothetical protein ACYCUZ_03550 [Cuniculiplasma sp.]|jgi:transposase